MSHVDLKDYTAEQLARALEVMDDFPHNTGGLSMLDEATMAWGGKYGHIAPLQKALADARHAHMRSYRSDIGNYSQEKWAEAIAAAHALAEAWIPRCKRPTGWGTCNFPLEDDGTCRGRDHTD